MAVVRGDIHIQHDLRRQKPRLHSASIKLYFAPDRYTSCSVFVYDPQTHLDDPAIFVSLGSAFAKLRVDQFDHLIEFLVSNRDDLVNALEVSQSKSHTFTIAASAAINQFNLVAHTSVGTRPGVGSPPTDPAQGTPTVFQSDDKDEPVEPAT